jgi:hypothetical protein
MHYTEFKDIRSVPSKEYPSQEEYFLDEKHSFYVEPIFYTQLVNVKSIYPYAFQKIIDEMFSLVKKNVKVVFVGDYEKPYIRYDDYIYIEISDILTLAKVVVEDKSRGSDYGD